jgi:hypothetical protein
MMQKPLKSLTKLHKLTLHSEVSIKKAPKLHSGLHFLIKS